MVTDDALLQRSAALPAFTDDQAGGQPKTLSDLGHVWADACKYRYNPPDVGKQAALAQLRARALQRGGNGISHLRFMLITNNRSPCWHGYEASGDAVVFDLARGA